MLDYKQIDWRLFGAALLLSIIGIFLIYSAQYNSTTDQSLDYYSKQIAWLVIAVIVTLVMIHMPIRMIDFFSYLFYGVALALLVLVLFIGYSKTGAARSFSLGPAHLTPSDVAKLALLVTLSRYLAYTKRAPESIPRIFISGLVALIPTLLIMRQPDLGTSLVFVVLLFSLWYWSGLSPLYLVLIISPLISLIAAFHWIAWIIYLAILIVSLMIFRPGLDNYAFFLEQSGWLSKTADLDVSRSRARSPTGRVSDYSIENCRWIGRSCR
jgi:rod shape determining protein RodA